MKELILVAALFVGGIYAGVCLTERVGYSAGFEKGYKNGMEAANSLIAGVQTR